MGDLPAFSLRASVLSGPKQVECRWSAGSRRKDEIRRASVAALANLDFSTGVSQSIYGSISLLLPFLLFFVCFDFHRYQIGTGRPVS